MNLAFRQVLSTRTFRLCEKVSPKSFQFPVASTCPIIQRRTYCENRMESRKLPQLMDFPPVVWPSLIKYMKNWMFANFIIRPYFDHEFSLSEFIEASKHAVQVVSECLQKSDFKTLEGLVEKDAIAALKNAISSLSVTQRQMLAIDKEDIFYAFPYQDEFRSVQDGGTFLSEETAVRVVLLMVGVMFDDSDKRWVEITMCYHVLKGLKQMQETGEVPPISLGVQPEYEDKIFVLNYRFIREFTKGVEDSWWVNIVNHFQPQTLAKKSM